jgi:uncharacterized protein
MSTEDVENVEVVRRIYAAFNNDEGRSILHLFDPGIEWDTLAMLRGTEVYRGYSGLRNFLATWLSAFEDYQVAPQEFIDAGSEVVVPILQRGRGKAAGVEAEWRFVHVWSLRRGKVVRLRTYADKAGALEAVGLSE